MSCQPLTTAPEYQWSQPIFPSFSKKGEQLLCVQCVSGMVLGICYKHELDMALAPQAADSVVREGKMQANRCSQLLLSQDLLGTQATCFLSQLLKGK